MNIVIQNEKKNIISKKIENEIKEKGNNNKLFLYFDKVFRLNINKR